MPLLTADGRPRPDGYGGLAILHPPGVPWLHGKYEADVATQARQKFGFCPVCRVVAPLKRVDTPKKPKPNEKCGGKCLGGNPNGSCECPCRGRCHGAGVCSCGQGRASNPPRGDEGHRGAERAAAAAGDPTSRSRAIVGRLRSGAIHSSAVALAAQLGDEAARLVAPDAPGWSLMGLIDVDLALENLGEQRFASWLLECGAHVGSRIGLSSHLGRALAKADRWTRGAGPPLEPEDVVPQRGTSQNERDRRAVQQVLYSIYVMFNMPDPERSGTRRVMSAVRALELCREAAGWLAQRKEQRLAEKISAQGSGRLAEAEWQKARLAAYLLGEE